MLDRPFPHDSTLDGPPDDPEPRPEHDPDDERDRRMDEERDLTADPAWRARNRDWLSTPKGRAHTAWHDRPWAEISADIAAEHRAEMLGQFPGATRQHCDNPFFD